MDCSHHPNHACGRERADLIEAREGVLACGGSVPRRRGTRLRHHTWIRQHGTDLPEVTDWVWEG